MAERSVSVKLRAEVSGYMANLRAASRATSDFSKDLVDRADRNRAQLETVGTALTGIGVAALGATGVATKAAVDWEASWVSVQKTVDGTSAQMAVLEDELREMARTLPATHEEIAAVAAAAGQLGIERESIAEFARTMIDLGNTTNLSAEEAATAIARFSNVMGTSHSDVDRLGSSLVELGNNSATTEADIMQMASRMAGAGNLIGATEADVLAMAAALSSVGIEAEAGGGSMSRVMQQIYTAVSKGGDAVEGFARVAGMSADEFATAFRDDPVRAINEFVLGLNDVEASGGNVVGVLNDIGIRSSEDMRTVLGLKGATDLLSESLGMSADAWEENSALADEAQQVYDTTRSTIMQALGSIMDAAISVGEVIAPAVEVAADAVGGLADAFGSLPGWVQGVIGVIGGLVGAMSLFGGAALLLLPRIADTRRAMRDLNLTGARLRGGMSRTGSAVARVGDMMRTHWKAGLVGVGLVVDQIIRSLNDLNPQIDAFATGIERWVSSGEIAGEMSRILGGDLEQLASGINKVNAPGFSKFVNAVIEGVPVVGGFIQDLDNSFSKGVERAEAFDSAMASLVRSGNTDIAAEAIRKLAEDTGLSIEEIHDALPEYSGAVEVAASETEKLGGAGEGAADGIDSVGDAAGTAEQEVSDLVDSLSDLNREFFDARAAARDYEQALDDANKTIAENGRTLDITTEAGRENEAALDRLAQAAVDAAEATLKEAQENGNLSEVLPIVSERLEQQKEDFIAAGLAAGMGRDEVEEFADELFALPPEVEPKVLVDKLQAEEAVARVNSLLDDLDKKRVTSYIDLVRTITTVDSGGGGSSGGPPLPLPTVGADGGLAKFASGGVAGYPNGGRVSGPGGPRTDSILAWLSNGEFVVNARDTARNLEALAAANQGARLVAVDDAPRMAGGGIVHTTPSVSPGGGSVVINVHAPNYVGPQSDLLRSLRRTVHEQFGGNVQRALGRA